nr:MAG TPA: hypothetical protein [Caudoviricetes sp.]
MEAPYLRCNYNQLEKLCQESPMMIAVQHHPKTPSEKRWQNVSDPSSGTSEKMLKNGASNHCRSPRQVTTTANHERAFVMCAISTDYKGVSKVANHDS